MPYCTIRSDGKIIIELHHRPKVYETTFKDLIWYINHKKYHIIFSGTSEENNLEVQRYVLMGREYLTEVEITDYFTQKMSEFNPIYKRET